MVVKQKFSTKWKSSKQIRKQRKYRANAPLHLRQKMVSAHLDKKLQKAFGRRSLPVRREDKVKIMRGKFKGATGMVTRVDLKKLKIYVDSAKRKKVSGQEVQVPIDPSNVKIIEIKRDDRMRQKAIKRKTSKEADKK
ncbi:MAG: 50S ribosomal protein L24 [Candidatus Aenigmarchaeota archaeon]|nr:50S ribosomal protein L24 [Candidatus Aenigmarchaeota archaeon]